jgi:lipoprotein signal peptidase
MILIDAKRNFHCTASGYTVSLTVNKGVAFSFASQEELRFSVLPSHN